VIDIVIPNWNGRELLATCLRSLQNQSFQSFRIIIIDNGSNDGSVSFVRDYYPDIHLITLSENEGFCKAVNKGIQASDNQLVLLLNNDVEVAEDCLLKLVEAARKNGDYDFFALKMIDFHQRTRLDGAGDSVMRGGVGYRLGTMEKDSAVYSIRRDVFGACGGAALYRRSLFESIGFFDEDFFAYLEDVDFNLRAVAAGNKCCYLPEAKIYHMGSASTGSKINSFTVRLSTRNNIYVVLKNFGPVLFLRFLPAFLIYQMFWLLFVIKKGHFVSYLHGLAESLKQCGIMMRRYGQNRRRRRLSRKEFGDLIVRSEKHAVASIMNRRAEQGKSTYLFKVYMKLFC